MILVSACLLGLRTKYDGEANTNELLQTYSHLGKFIPVCPEQLGGLTTPREPAEILEGTGKEVLQNNTLVTTEDGKDLSGQFIRGAKEVVGLSRMMPIKAAILKERSPSCGVGYVYNGSFSKGLVQGQGVTTAALEEEGIPVYSEEELTVELIQKLLELD